MYQKLETGSVIATRLELRYKQEEDIEYYRASFPRAKWAFFENEFYESDISTFNSGTNEHYRTIYAIPKYTIFKKGKKIGIALPRVSEFADKKFLFVPNTYKQKWNVSTNVKKYSVLRDYYIYEVDDDYVIEDGARLFFYQ